MQVLFRSKQMLWRVYKTEGARNIALAKLRKQTNNFNYFVLYRDVQGYALNAGWASWVQDGSVHVDR